MKVCIIGGGLTSLTLANVLIKKGYICRYFLKKKNFMINQEHWVFQNQI